MFFVVLITFQKHIQCLWLSNGLNEVTSKFAPMWQNLLIYNKEDTHNEYWNHQVNRYDNIQIQIVYTIQHQKMKFTGPAWKLFILPPHQLMSCVHLLYFKVYSSLGTQRRIFLLPEEHTNLQCRKTVEPLIWFLLSWLWGLSLPLYVVWAYS